MQTTDSGPQRTPALASTARARLCFFSLSFKPEIELIPRLSFHPSCTFTLELSTQFADFGANETLACRDPSRADSAKVDLELYSGSKNITVMALDVSSFASIRAFVSAWGSKPIDILIK